MDQKENISQIYEPIWNFWLQCFFISYLKYKLSPRKKWCFVSTISHANIFYFSLNTALVFFITLAVRTKLNTKDIEQQQMANSASVPLVKAASSNIDQNRSIITGSHAHWTKVCIIKSHVLHTFSSTCVSFAFSFVSSMKDEFPPYFIEEHSNLEFKHYYSINEISFHNMLSF